MRAYLAVAVGDRGDLALLLLAEVVEPAAHRLDVPPPLPLLLLREQRQLRLRLNCGELLQRVGQVAPECGEDLPRPVQVRLLATGQLLVDPLVVAFRSGLHRLQQPGPQRRSGLVPTADQVGSHRIGSQGELIGVQRLVEQPLGPLLGDDPPATQSYPGQEDLLVQSQPPRPTSTIRVTAATKDSSRPSTTTAVTRCSGASALHSDRRSSRCAFRTSGCP